jgi:hypothetical protein
LLFVLAVVFGLGIGEYNESYTQFLAVQRQLEQAKREGDAGRQQQLLSEAQDLYTAMTEPQQRATWHKLIGIVAGLVAVLVNSIAVTYFIGTGRWCKEVVDTYQLDRELANESARLKRKCFPWSFVGIAVVLLVAAFGAAADPGTLRPTTMRWVLPHYLTALGGGALLAFAFWIQARFIEQNTDLVERILSQVRLIRAERGLDVNP